MRDARINNMRAPRARLFAQSFRTPLRGTEGKKRPANPEPEMNEGR
jgi:hypothetical protein